MTTAHKYAMEFGRIAKCKTSYYDMWSHETYEDVEHDAVAKDGEIFTFADGSVFNAETGKTVKVTK